MRKIFLIIILLLAGDAYATAPAPSMLVYNITQEEIVFAQNADTVRPIASITKLVTAMVALDAYGASAEPVVKTMLVTSSNSAAEHLAKQYPGGRTRFITAMNNKVKDMGLTDTRFHDPSGLSVFNSSTAIELVLILQHAAEYNVISDASTTKGLVKVTKHKKKNYTMVAHNTNIKLLQKYSGIVVGKTGFTSRAGRCLAVLIRHQNETFVVIALGYPTAQQRETVMINLMNNYARPKLLNIAFKE